MKKSIVCILQTDANVDRFVNPTQSYKYILIVREIGQCGLSAKSNFGAFSQYRLKMDQQDILVQNSIFRCCAYYLNWSVFARTGQKPPKLR